MRTCVGCRRVRPKRELVRVVRGPDGAAIVDDTGTAPGRGAYLCLDPECPPRAREAGVSRALRAPGPAGAARLDRSKHTEGTTR